jgi:hypothetical protein
MDILKNVRAMSNYGSSLVYKIGEKKMGGFKFHDWHNVLHDLMPIAICGTLTEDIRETICMLSNFFKKLCAKEIRVDDYSFGAGNSGVVLLYGDELATIIS